jgi:hypothetical protein
MAGNIGTFLSTTRDIFQCFFQYFSIFSIDDTGYFSKNRNIGTFETEITIIGAFLGTSIGEADRRRAGLVLWWSHFVPLLSPNPKHHFHTGPHILKL